MDITSLSEIFDDPLLNEFTDDLLKDIDVSDFQFIHTNLENSGLTEEESWPTSNHCTLESLLKSQKPLSCVPPAPEFRSERNVGTLKCSAPRVPPLQDLNAQIRRNSLPLLKKEYESVCTTGKGTYHRGRSKLISDYLGKCDDNLDSISPSRFLGRDQNNSTADLSITKKELYPDSFSGDSATESLEQLIDNPVGFRCSEISPTSDKNPYACQMPCDEKNVRRAPHNAIEKRYRASINGRIDELRSLLIPHPTNETKLNKSAVLRQAIERIKELEETTNRLQAELMTLRSMHSSDHLKPCHNSPDSGISSGSSYSGIDTAGFTPPSSGVLNGPAYHMPMESHSVVYTAAKDVANSASEATDIYNWAPDVPPAANFIDFPESGCPYPPHVPHPYELNTMELPGHTAEPPSNVHIVHSEHGPLWRSHSGNTLATLTTPGGRFKRRAVSIHPGPNKFRRPTIPSSEYAAPHQPPVPNLIRSGSLLVKTCATTPFLGSHSPITPTFSTTRPMPQSGRPSEDLPATPTVSSNAPVAGSGLNGWAARTTLCMTALSLIALDPVVLSGTSSDPVISSSIPDPSSRRLLSALNTHGQTSSPWLVWLVYGVQWIVALCLCLWACRMRGQRVVRDSTRSDHAVVQALWDDARKAWSQASWLTAKQKLSTCLAKLDPEPRFATWTAATSCSLTQQLVCQFHCLVDWLALYIRISFGLLTRMASLLIRLRRPNMPTPQTGDQRATADWPLSQLTPANVHWSLLELYLLVPRGSLGNWPQFDHSFAFLTFLWRCMKLFVDDCLACFAGRSDKKAYSVDSLLRRGITLVLVLLQSGSTQFSQLSSVFQFILYRCIRRLSCFAQPHTLWAQIANDPILWKLVIGPARLVITAGHTVDPTDDLFEQAVRRALEQRLMDRCSRAIVTIRESDGSDLDRPLAALLGLSSAAANGRAKMEGSESLAAPISDGDIRAHWWAQVIQALRATRQQSVSALAAPGSLSPDSVVPTLPVPPPAVLQSAQTGLLAESVWLVYCPSSALDAVEAAQRCGLGLCRYVKQLSIRYSTETPGHGCFVPVDGETHTPYWILVCAQTIADRALSILARALLTSKTCLAPDTEMSEPCQLIESFNAAFWVLQQSSVLLRLDQSDWVVKKISYYETVRRLLAGANPVQSRFSLMHAYRDVMMNQPVSDPGHLPVDLVAKRPHGHLDQRG